MATTVPSYMVPCLSKRTKALLRERTGMEPEQALRHLIAEIGTIKGIAREVGVNRNTIYQALSFFGITMPKYNHSEFMREHMASLTPEEREDRVAPAHAAVKGKPRPREQKLRSARSHQQNARNHLSKGERRVLNILRGAGLTCTPHFAIDIYNIDIALPDCRVAIEVQGGHWHTAPRKAKQDKRKHRYLREQGWHVVEFWGSPAEIEQAAHDWLKTIQPEHDPQPLPRPQASTPH